MCVNILEKANKKVWTIAYEFQFLNKINLSESGTKKNNIKTKFLFFNLYLNNLFSN